jgi:UDP-N-acetylmuramate--alanine ligase
MTSKTYAHFIGVGGAGMSGIARVLHDRGVAVTGSDLKMSRYARNLAERGVPVAVGHAAENLGDPEVVVVSSAIPESNPELAAARRRGIPVWPRAKMLADTAEGKLTVAVAGTHGKTTTSSMVTSVLRGLGADPTFVIGGELAGVGSNAECGEGDHAVLEADESDGSFLYLRPHMALVTNVEADHLDHYAGIDEVVDTFRAFVDRLPEDGVLVVCADDARLMEAVADAPVRVVTYGTTPGADLSCEIVSVGRPGYEFVVRSSSGEEAEAAIRVPGRHNVLNATGALAAAHALGFDLGEAAATLERFGGVRRRFDEIDVVEGVTVVDDYAHHPTEVRATIEAAREAGYDRIWAIFQPHRYSRTAALGADFSGVFEEADRVVLMDVYSAGEAPIPGVSGKTLVEAVLGERPRTRLSYFPHRQDVASYVVPRARSGDIVMTMGAGDVTDIGTDLVRELRRRYEEV